MHFAAVTVLAAASAALATPIESQSKTVLPLRKVHAAKSAKGLVNSGNAKLRNVNGDTPRGKVEAGSGPATNEVVSYLASITVGSTSYDLIVDTGSSNTWVGAGKKYSAGSTGKDTGNSVEVNYGSGGFNGEEYIDTVSFAGLTVKSQSVGVASSAHGFNNGTDGILGVGPVGLTRGTVSNTQSVPTFLDNLYSQGSISQEVLGVSFRPESGSDTNDANGELTLGGVDSTKFTGSLSYFNSPGPYWGVAASFTYGSKSLGSGNGIVDTGTTLIYVPTRAFNAYVSASGGKVDNENTGLVAYTTKPTSNFNVIISGKTYSLTPDQYLVPEAQYENLEIPKGKFYSWIVDGGNSGVNVIIGQKFLEHYYSAYDTNNRRVGFAPNA